MHQKIRSAFAICSSNNCLEQSNSRDIYIKDIDNSKCQILAEREKHTSHFHIINSTSKDIFLLAIDKCIYTDNSHKKCDFASFDNKTFCFVEIKDTLNRAYKKKGVEQLKTTIIKFKDLIDFTGYDLEAIISWRYRPLRPAVSTLMQSSKLEFITTLRTRLLEGNQKEFL